MATSPAAKSTRTVSPSKAPAGKKAASRGPRTGPVSTNGRSQAAEMLREIQIDGKALSVQIERLRHRFL